MEKHPINEIMGLTMENLKNMVDANTVVGEPIHTPDGVTVIPVSKFSFGFASGGSDLPTKNSAQDKKGNFGGGGGAGVNIMPVAFLIIKNDSVRLLPVDVGPAGPVEKVIDLVPELVNKVSDMVDKRKAAKADEKKPAAEPETAESASEAE